jgi:hypothetical protein
MMAVAMIAYVFFLLGDGGNYDAVATVAVVFA